MSNVKKVGMRRCKTEPLCESPIVELIFAQPFKNAFALSLECGRSQETQLSGSFFCLGGFTFIDFNSHDVQHVCKYGLDS